MAIKKIKKKLAAVNRDIQEEHPRSILSRATNVLKIKEEYVIQDSKEIEGRVTKMIYQEFNRAENQILVALSILEEFLLNSHVLVQSGTFTVTSSDTNTENKERNEDCSQNGPHPEADITVNRPPRTMIRDPVAVLHMSGQLIERDPVRLFQTY